MSFFSSLSKAASQAAEAAQAAATSAAEAAKATYADLTAYPSEIKCSGCQVLLKVPEETFQWICINGHSNLRKDEKCTVADCNGLPPDALPEPTIKCPTCHVSTVVPETNASKNLMSAGDELKTAAQNAAEDAKKTYEHMKSAPTTFNCVHCNGLLMVPTGAWSCQTCTTLNQEHVEICPQCTQKKRDQRVICGVCRKSTKVPTTNFENTLSAKTKELSLDATKVYYDLSKKPYVTCGTCNNHIDLPESMPAPAEGGVVELPCVRCNGKVPVPPGTALSEAPVVE